MKNLILIGLILTSSLQAFAKDPAATNKFCTSMMDTLGTEGALSLHIRKYLRDNNSVPAIAKCVMRIKQFEGATFPGPSEVKFVEFLRELGVEEKEWQEIETLVFEEKLNLGSPNFLESLKEVKFSGGTGLSDKGRIALVRLHNITKETLEKITVQLSEIEENSLRTRNRFLTEEELNKSLQEYTRESKFTYKDLGWAAKPPNSILNTWHSQILKNDEKLEKFAKRSLVGALVKVLADTNRIPEDTNVLLALISAKMNITPEEVKSFFGPISLFSSLDDLINTAKAPRAAIFRAALDERIFSKAYEARMKEAIRNANNWIVFKLVEKQDLGNIGAILAASERYNAPIILIPAFAEVGEVPKRLHDLFNHPNVFVSLHNFIQLDKSTFIVNDGSIDKLINPLTKQPFLSSDRVFVASPTIMSVTTASKEYGRKVGYRMTTGSMSIPQYRGKYYQNMKADFVAQQTALLNRGLTIISRDYVQQDVGPLVGGAHETGGRRLKYVDAKYGNSAGLYDLNVIITDEGKVEKIKYLPAVIMSDLHRGATDPALIRGVYQTFEQVGAIVKNPLFNQLGSGFQFEYLAGDLKIGAIVLHDADDGMWANHYIFDKLVTLSKTDKSGLLDIGMAARTTATTINQMARLFPDTQIIIAVGNHDHDRLKAILEKADWKSWHSPGDLDILARLMSETLEEGGNPYERLLTYYGVYNGVENVRFMDPHDSFRVGVDLNDLPQFSEMDGTQIADHTNNGVNGARSISLKGLYDAYGSIAGGHTHTSGEYNQAVRVASFTVPVQSYHTGGPSSCDASLLFVYSAKGMQLLREANWTFIPNATEVQPPEKFYPPLLPRFVGWPEVPEGGPMTDQLNSRQREHKTSAGKK